MNHQPSADHTRPRRINVRGTTGVGKTTFAAELAHRLGVPHIELDALHHGPNWSEPTPEDFRATVRDVMDRHPDGWVIDGSYDAKLGDMVTAEADGIVWLDLPLLVTMPRLWRRTLHRVFRNVELWNGNRETWRDQFLSRQSIFIWSVIAHRRHRHSWPAKFGSDPRFVRLRTRGEARRWLESQGQ
jgi:adenylate kinase family enzyme